MRKDNHGFTLVEMVVTLTLIGILTPLIFSVLDAGIRISQRMMDANRAAVIAEIILDRVSDRISQNEELEVCLDTKDAAALCEGLFADEFYMGYEVEELHAEIEKPDQHPEVLRLDLTLKHRRSKAVHRAFRYMEIYDAQNPDEGAEADLDEIPLINDY